MARCRKKFTFTLPEVNFSLHVGFGEAWEPSKEHCGLGNQGALDRSIFAFLVYKVLTL
jgi:hypothetical protein